MKLRAVLVGFSLLCGCASHDAPQSGDEAPIELAPPSELPAEVIVKQPEEPEAVREARRRSDISLDEEVELFPTFVAVDAKGQVRGRLEGWIYEPEEEDALRATFLASIDRGLGHGDDDLDAGLAVERIRPFIVDDERGERVEVRIGDRVVAGSKSSQGGRFYVPLRFTLDEDESREGPWVARAITREADKRHFKATIYVLGETGRIVISDIDDTVKISEVLDKKKLLRRTFLEPFEMVPEIHQRYRGWLGEGGHLHFVSSSPWQLFRPLHEAITKAGFPAASYTLRNFRVDVVDAAELLTAPDNFKTNAIENVIERLPTWKVVLVGDSGERDPEIYGVVARKYPEQVERVFIRDVTGQGGDDPRYEEAFKDVPAERWQVFKEAGELPESL